MGQSGQAQQNKIPDHRFKQIEAMLYRYEQIQEDIIAIRQDIIHRVPYKELIVQTGFIADATAQKAVELTTDTDLLYLEYALRTINRSLKALPKVHNELFRLKYVYKYADEEALDKLSVSRRTYYYYRRQIVEEVASNMGRRKNSE